MPEQVAEEAIRALASSEGVDDALLAEWRRSQPDLPKRSEAAARDNARKACFPGTPRIRSTMFSFRQTS